LMSLMSIDWLRPYCGTEGDRVAASLILDHR